MNAMNSFLFLFPLTTLTWFDLSSCQLRIEVRHETIIGGTEGSIQQTPYHIVIIAEIVRDNKTNYFYCGGSVIDEKWLITAAHCLPEGSNTKIKILGGTDHLNSTKSVNLVAKKIILFNNYDMKSPHLNDICLIKLAAPIKMENNIKPVSLPKVIGEVENFKRATVTGFGVTSKLNNAKKSNVLMKAEMKILKDIYCEKIYKNIFNRTMMVCAGYMSGKKDSCSGDSGGPLVGKTDDGSNVLIGIVSFGFECARANRPGIYTRVSTYLGWINDTMKNN